MTKLLVGTITMITRRSVRKKNMTLFVSHLSVQSPSIYQQRTVWVNDIRSGYRGSKPFFFIRHIYQPLICPAIAANKKTFSGVWGWKWLSILTALSCYRMWWQSQYTECWPDVVSMLIHRLRRWPNVKTTLSWITISCLMVCQWVELRWRPVKNQRQKHHTPFSTVQPFQCYGLK